MEKLIEHLIKESDRRFAEIRDDFVEIKTALEHVNDKLAILHDFKTEAKNSLKWAAFGFSALWGLISFVANHVLK
jgi:hypothetical protein